MSTRIAVTLSADFITNLLRDGATAPATLVEGGVPADSKLERVEYLHGAPTMRLVFKSEAGAPAAGYDAEVVQDLKPLLVSNGNVKVNPADILTTGPVSSADPDERARQELAQLRAAGKIPPAPAATELTAKLAAHEKKLEPQKPAAPPARQIVPGLDVEEPKGPEFVDAPVTEAGATAPEPLTGEGAGVPLTEAEQIAAETGVPISEVQADTAPPEVKNNKGGRPKGSGKPKTPAA